MSYSPRGHKESETTKRLTHIYTVQMTEYISDQLRNVRSNCQYLLDNRKRKKNPKIIYFCFLDFSKNFHCVDHNKLWKILKEMEIPNLLTCLLRNLYVDQEATARTRHGTTDWFQVGKGVLQGCILSPCLFNLYAEYIKWNAGQDVSQVGISRTSTMLMTPP